MNTRLNHAVQQVFAADGVLSQMVDGYRCRSSQQQMAALVVDALCAGDNLVVEAGTGIGKTYAYLAPALLSARRVIISTGSKNLQEQLFFKDLPTLLKMLNLSPKIALLKGRNNYLCQHYLEQQINGSDIASPQAFDDLLKINHWAGQTTDGDISGLNSVSENSAVLPLVVSTKERCINKACSYYQQCFTRKARQKAVDAQVIVVNHHLFFADRILKETGFAELLPDGDMVIFDEAHLLPDIAVNYFGQQIRFKHLTNVIDHIRSLYHDTMADAPQLEEMSLYCHAIIEHWQTQLLASQQQDWRQLVNDKVVMTDTLQLIDALTKFDQLLVNYLGRNAEFDDAVDKFNYLLEQLNGFFRCDKVNSAYSIEYGARSITVKIIPIDVTSECKQLFDASTSWIFTSATLQINRDLSIFCRSLGLETAKKRILDSPFDYARQALFCVPRYLSPVSSHHQAVEQLTEVAVKAINAAQGRTFMLFTSHKMLNRLAVALRDRIHYPLLVQGQAGKQTLLKKYRQLGNAVLLGTGAFWEGVDVRGKLLSCVIIDKLPFVPPDDPLYRAKSQAVIRQGGDPFMSLSLPQAVIALNQGAGRLIRDENDRGVLILCDNRIVNRHYGSAFIGSLPPMSRSRDLEQALQFLQKIDGD